MTLNTYLCYLMKFITQKITCEYDSTAEGEEERERGDCYYATLSRSKNLIEEQLGRSRV